MEKLSMNKIDPNIIKLTCSKRTVENIENIAQAMYYVAIGKFKAPIQFCTKTYETLLVEDVNIFDTNHHFDWYLFPCHCESVKYLNFDPFENKYDALFFLYFCRCFEEGPKYSKEQIGNAPDIRMAICKKAIDQWFDPKRNETYWIRLLKVVQHLDYTLRSLMILESKDAYRYFEFILKEICLPHFKDVNCRYKLLYKHDKNFNNSIAFLNYLSCKFDEIKKSGVSDEKEILHKVYDNVFNNVSDRKNSLKKVPFDAWINVNIKNNQVGFCQHFLFILLFILLCLSLFLCFKVSIYFLIPSVICFAFDLYLGFRNYFYGYYCTQKIEIPLTLNYKSNLEQIYPNQKEPCSIDNKLGSVHIKQK